jgi:hypothetical protein
VAAHPTIAHKMLHDQWKQLVLRPFQELRAAAAGRQLQPPSAAAVGPLVLVIDALDECRSEREIRFVTQLLSETTCLAVEQLKIFLTSRPEVAIREGMLNVPANQRQHLILHHIEQSIVDQDIRVFFERRLGDMIQKRLLTTRSSEADIIRQLVDKAGGLFIWAATAYRSVHGGRSRAQKRLDTLLADRVFDAETSPERKLDEIYTSVLQNTLRDDFTDDEKRNACDDLRTVLGSITVLFSALEAPALAALLDLPEVKMRDILREVHSIVDVPGDCQRPVRPHHASVRDYPVNKH